MLPLLLFLLAPGGSWARSPHIIVVMMDDVGYADISLGGAEYPTPNIDALATSGVTLTKFYTAPTCSPTRASFMTGRYPFGTGLQDLMTVQAGTKQHIPNNIPTISEMLQTQGYHTMMFGKWHLGYAADHDTPTGRGFDTFDGYYQGMGDYYFHYFGTQTNNGYDLWNNTQANWEANGTYSADLYTSYFQQRLQQYVSGPAAEKPLFALFAMHTVHTLINPSQLPPKLSSACDAIDNVNRSMYCQKMVYADSKIGEVFQSLKQAGIWEDTYVIWLSDNGGMPYWTDNRPVGASYGCNIPLRGGKLSYLEGGVKTLSMIAGPLVARDYPELVNTTFDGLTHVMDYTSTIVQGLAGLQMTERQDGNNFWPAVTRQTKWVRTFQFLNAQTDGISMGSDCCLDGRCNCSGALIDWPYKFLLGVQPYDGYYPCDQSPPLDVKYESNVVLLFNLQEDPLESEDLSFKYPNLVQQYTQIMLGLFDNSTLYMPMQNASTYQIANPALHNMTWAPFLPFNLDEKQNPRDIVQKRTKLRQ